MMVDSTVADAWIRRYGATLRDIARHERLGVLHWSVGSFVLVKVAGPSVMLRILEPDLK